MNIRPISQIAAALTTKVLAWNGGVLGHILVSDIVTLVVSGHNHDSDYADINHNHDADYADSSHNHDSAYAALSHGHEEFLTQAEIEALPGFGGGGASLPVGVIMLHFGASVPDGWYLLNGQSISDTSDLGVFLEAAGITDNGDGTIDLPDWREFSPMGASTTRALLDTDGEFTTTLTESQMPPHSGHTWLASSAGGGSEFRGTQSKGGGLAHNTLHPVVYCNYIIYGG